LLATFVGATPAATPVFIACDGAQALAAHELRHYMYAGTQSDPGAPLLVELRVDQAGPAEGGRARTHGVVLSTADA
jgi:hypothetical protein